MTRGAVWWRAARTAVLTGASSVVLLVVVAALGESATSPPLGPRGWSPAWDVGADPSPGLVVVLQVVAYLLGGASVWYGLQAVNAGWRPAPRAVAATVLVAVGALVLVPPFGSADHLSYAAYGRITAQGGDPYLVAPDAWRDGTDPVTASARPPWADTTSVYGPVGTALQALASLVGGDSVRMTVWLLQLLVGAGFLVTAWLIDRTTRADAELRARGSVLWATNPVLLGVLVGGAHLDAICSAAAMAALVIATSRTAVPGLLLGGVLTGVAAGIKLPYGAVGLALVAALLWLQVRRPRDLGGEVRRWRRTLTDVATVLVGVAIVLVPAQLWAGPHVYDQARRASRFTSLATPWRSVMNALDALIGPDPRASVPWLFGLLGFVVLFAVRGLWLRQRSGSVPASDGPAQALPRTLVAQIFLALGVAYLLASPYVLPWYDALGWAPLAVVAGGFGLDGALLLRGTTLALAYTPGLVDGTSNAEALMLDARQFVAPLVTAGVLVWVLARGLPPAWHELVRVAAGARRSGRRPIASG